MDEPLKRCPFCGGKASIMLNVNELTPATIYVECEACGCRSPGYEPTEVNSVLRDIGEAVSWAVRGWNLRAGDSDG
ncbi:MAG: Lar family restriction alleviation protein [Clostridiales bacterium]|nr:Lar family restriction alleviation protein [Clostridiales bacterium]MCC8074629.1 Lar family restriction alleviation protein [Clostridiales bacterium]MCC8100058.1 Lar family restriction alleviation protein [Clostridiales bacterium]